MRIDVWSDVVCPWCFVGLANLDRALEVASGVDEVHVVLHSFQLDPRAVTQSPEEHTRALARKYGTSVEQVRLNQDRLTALGAERGLDLRFDRAISGNTYDAHRLLHLALERGVQRLLKDRLGRAYYTDGEPIGAHDTLRKAAVDVGLDPAEVDEVLAGDAYADAVADDIAAARELDITGVPFFVVDGRFALSGAQPPELLLRVLRNAQAEQAAASTGAGSVGQGCGPEGCAV